MKRLILFVLLAFSTHSALAQIQHGTIAVVYFSKDKNKIVVAADSRVVSHSRVVSTGRAVPTDNTAPNDSACKIVAPYGKIVFTASNLTGFHQPDITGALQSWSSFDEVYSAYKRAAASNSTDHDRLIGTANEWAQSVATHLEHLIRVDPKGVDESAQGSSVLTRALFGGIGNDGKLTLLEVDISYQPNIATDVDYRVRPWDCPLSFCAIGETEIAEEFRNRTSSRAKTEAKDWKPPKGSAPKDYDIWKTMRFVDLTVQYDQKTVNGQKDVGGPIDAVEMDQDGSVRWFALKPNCKKD